MEGRISMNCDEIVSDESEEDNFDHRYEEDSDGQENPVSDVEFDIINMTTVLFDDTLGIAIDEEHEKDDEE